MSCSQSGPQNELRACKSCQHFHLRQPTKLFNGTDLQSPGVLKAQTEWDQENRQRAQQELQRFRAQQPFEYEPHHYAWCAAYTKVDLVERARAGDKAAFEELMQKGGGCFDPVTGEISPLYVLCAWVNPSGQCADYVERIDANDNAGHGQPNILK
jgi:hypothetical protein